MKTKRLLLSILLSLASACSGSGGGGAAVTLDDLPAQQAAIYCQKSFACCDAAELTERFGEFGSPAPADEAACRTQVTRLISLADQKALIAAGKVSYDADAAGECLALARSLTCEAFGEGELLECEGMLTGRVAVGQACEDDAECAGHENGTHACDGSTCAALPRSGEACQDRCVDGLACIDDRCEAERADGATCSGDGDCENHHCVAGSAGNGTCQPREAAGFCDGH